MRTENVLIQPLLTEKTNVLREKENTYVFCVQKRANKAQVKAALKSLFSQDAISCRIVNVHPKVKPVMSRSRHQRGHGKTSSWKKAYVTFASGVNIPLWNEE